MADAYLVEDGKLVKEVTQTVRETFSLEVLDQKLAACQAILDDYEAEKTRLLALKAKAEELGVKPVTEGEIV
mgnify:CR=1 FL=1